MILLPAAFFMEKNGTISNSGGMVQWRYAAVKPPGQAKPDGEIVDLVFRKVRDLSRTRRSRRTRSSSKAFWTYTTAEDVLREINGRVAARTTRRRASRRATSSARSAICRPTARRRPAPGSTRASSPAAKNLSKRRDSKTDPGGLGLYPGFGWTWPNNMRILYNRASCDRNGKPYPGSKPIIWWDEQAKRWTGHDMPDVPVATDGPGHAERPARRST